MLDVTVSVLCSDSCVWGENSNLKILGKRNATQLRLLSILMETHAVFCGSSYIFLLKDQATWLRQ